VLPSAIVVFSISGLTFGTRKRRAPRPIRRSTTPATAVSDLDLRDPAIWTVTTQGDRVIPAGGSARLDISANPTRLTGGVLRQLNVQVSGDRS
jgi:hypothetical protein